MNFIEHFKVDGKRNFAERVTLWEYAYIPYYIDPTCKYACKYECIGSPKSMVCNMLMFIRRQMCPLKSM